MHKIAVAIFYTCGIIDFAFAVITYLILPPSDPFACVGRAETKKTVVSLDQLVKEGVAEIGQDTRGRDIVWRINPLPV